LDTPRLDGTDGAGAGGGKEAGAGGVTGDDLPETEARYPASVLERIGVPFKGTEGDGEYMISEDKLELGTDEGEGEGLREDKGGGVFEAFNVAIIELAFNVAAFSKSIMFCSGCDSDAESTVESSIVLLDSLEGSFGIT